MGSPACLIYFIIWHTYWRLTFLMAVRFTECVCIRDIRCSCSGYVLWSWCFRVRERKWLCYHFRRFGRRGKWRIDVGAKWLCFNFRFSLDTDRAWGEWAHLTPFPRPDTFFLPQQSHILQSATTHAWLHVSLSLYGISPIFLFHTALLHAMLLSILLVDRCNLNRLIIGRLFVNDRRSD